MELRHGLATVRVRDSTCRGQLSPRDAQSAGAPHASQSRNRRTRHPGDRNARPGRHPRVRRRRAESDGGFGMTQSAVPPSRHGLGAARAQRRPPAPGPAALGYVRRGLPSLRDIGDVERTVLVVRAAGQNPRRFGGRNLIADIMRHRDRDGSFDGFVKLHVVRDLRVAPLRRQPQLRHDPERRAVAGAPPELRRRLQRRRARGERDRRHRLRRPGAGARRPARLGAPPRRDVLARAQASNGGFPLSRGGAANAQSTAYAVQGLVAAGGHGAAVRRGQAYLRSLTESNGLVRYSRTSRQTPVWVSAQALLALHRRTF